MVEGVHVPLEVAIDHPPSPHQSFFDRPDRPGLELAKFPKIVLMAEDLKVENPDIVAGRPGSLGHPFHAERFQPEVKLGVHQAARVDQQDFHRFPPPNPLPWRRREKRTRKSWSLRQNSSGIIWSMSIPTAARVPP